MYGLLNGMTIVEGAAFIAAPFCALHCAQMGATVIRFDQIGGGPDYGRWPLAANGASHYWEGLNKGKKSIALNLATPPGRELAQRIATSGDGLFVTNFPEHSFLSYDRLATLRPDLICIRIMGWADGTPAVDYTINAAVGVPMMTGQASDPVPVNHVLPAWDLLAGAYAAFALLAADRDRAQNGQGREVRIALSDIAAATLGHLGCVAEAHSSGDRSRLGNDLFGAFGRDFLCRDGARVMVVAITPRQWTGLVEALNLTTAVAALESQLGVSFLDEGTRFTHREALNALVAEKIAARVADDLEASFAANGVCWSRYRSVAGSIANEPQLFSDNPVFSSVEHPSGNYLTPGAAARLPQDVRLDAAPAPSLGQHTDEILATLLGMSEGEIARLHDSGVVA